MSRIEGCCDAARCRLCNIGLGYQGRKKRAFVPGRKTKLSASEIAEVEAFCKRKEGVSRRIFAQNSTTSKQAEESDPRCVRRSMLEMACH